MRGFSAADAPLLDELAELLGVDDAAERERARRQWRAQIADAQGALDILTGSAPQDLEDELDPEILMAYDLIDASQLAERHDVGQHQTTAERAAGDRTWTYGHVIVDEAQELSEMAWRMLMRRIPNRWMTLVGDTAQTGDPAGTSSWQRILEPYVAKRWKLTELTVNYRTPAEIMTSARRVLAEIDAEQTVPRSVRESGFAPWALRGLRGRLRRHRAHLCVPGNRTGHDCRDRGPRPRRRPRRSASPTPSASSRCGTSRDWSSTRCSSPSRRTFSTSRRGE